MAYHSTQSSGGRTSKDFGSISIPSPSTAHFSTSSSPTTKDVVDEETNARGTWGSLFNFTATPHLWSLILGILLSIITGLITPAMAIFLGRLLNVFADRTAGLIDDSELLQRVSINAVYIMVVGSASWLLKGGYFTYWISFGELQAKRVRDKLYDGMLAKEMGWFDTRKAGINAMLPRLQTQIRELQTATSQPLGFVAQYIVTLIASVGVAFYMAWDLTLVTLATFPIGAFALSFISSRMQSAIQSQTEELTTASKITTSAIAAIDTVKCFNGQEHELQQYTTTIKRAATYYLKQARGNALQSGFVRILLLGMFVQGFWYGSYLVDNGRRTTGQIFTCFYSCLMATQTFEQVLPHVIVLEKGKAAGAAMRGLLNRINGGVVVEKGGRGRTPKFCDGAIDVKNVTFSYPSRPDRLALDNVSFSIPSGEMTFIVGKSGSGKSTVSNLLLRFYQAISGEITIDGQAIQDLDIKWLRNNITLVQQQSILFNETIFKNIALGRTDHNKVSHSQVKQAIFFAALDETIKDMDKGLDTLVGAGGNSLSGGQRQRVALARARLRDAPVLILDEATSALDETSRKRVMEAVRSWRRDKTTIIITHDITQIEPSDFVYVMENGCVVEAGYRSALECTIDGHLSKVAETKDGSVEENVETPNSTPDAGSLDDIPDLLIMKPRHVDASEIELPISERPNSRLAVSRESHRRGPFVEEMASTLAPIATQGTRMSRMSFMPDQGVIRSPEPTYANSPISPLAVEESNQRYYYEESQVVGMSEISQSNSSATTQSQSSPNSKSSLRSTFIRKRNRRAEDSTESKNAMSLSTILKTVWSRLTWDKRVVLLLGFLAAAVHAGAVPVFSWIFANLLQAIFDSVDHTHKAMLWSVSILALAAVDATAAFTMHYFLEICGQTWVDSLRCDAMGRIMDQPKAWYDKDRGKLSQLIETLDRSPEEMRNLVGRFACFVFVALVMIVVTILWALIVCWKLTLVVLATGPFMYGVTRGFESVSTIWEGKSNDAGEAAGSIFTETFANIKLVRALTLEAYFHEKYFKATKAAAKVGTQRAVFSGLFFGMADAGIIFITALIFWYGARLVAAREWDIHSIVTVFTMLIFTLANVNAIQAFIPQISSSRDTASRLIRLTQLPYMVSHEHSGQIRIKTLPGTITFNNVNFAYPTRPDEPVLKLFSLRIPLHTSVALVGSSGSGKSTVTALLLGLYPAWTPMKKKGSAVPSRRASVTNLSHHSSTFSTQALKLGTFSLKDLHLPSYRSLVALVRQQTVLFPGTIAENITYGLPFESSYRSQSAIEHAARLAGIDGFINSLPSAYNTIVGDGGTTLSGGQTQRIGIARALVRQPELLIMDEPTSSLDAESAKEVRASIAGLVNTERREGERGTTVLVVTHAWEMMRDMGRCVVLDGGRVVEDGRFDDLMRSSDGVLRKILGRGK